MKSLLWIFLALLVPISATSQQRLFFHATVSLPITGWTDDTTGGCSFGGEPITPINGDIDVQFNDTLSLVEGDNHVPLKSARVDWGHFNSLPGNYSFQYDSQSHTIYDLQVTASQVTPTENGSGPDAQNELNITVSLDSISIGIVSDSNWTFTGDHLSCSYSCDYYYQYLMMTGAEGWQKASGQGQTPLVNANANSSSVEISAANSSSSLRITSLGNGAVEIERSTNGPADGVEIFDALGHVTAHITMDGNVARIPSLVPGLYFARLGDQVAKFVVPPR